MSDLKRIGSTDGPTDHIEEAEFVEVDDAAAASPPRHEPPPGMPSKSDKRLIAVFAAILIPFMIVVVANAGGQPAEEATSGTANEPTDTTTDDGALHVTSPATDRDDHDGPALPQQSHDLAQFIDPSLKPYAQFQIDSDAEAPSGPGHRCNRGAIYQYFFNQEAPGTYISWFNDPQTPDMAIGEMGTYGFEEGRIHLRAIRGTVYLKKSDGSLRTIEVPDDKLPPEKNAEVTKGSDRTFGIGGVPFRRCDGYF